MAAMSKPFAATHTRLRINLLGHSALQQWHCRPTSPILSIRVRLFRNHSSGHYVQRIPMCARPLSPVTIDVRSWQIRRQSTSPPGNDPAGGGGPRRLPPQQAQGRVPIFRLLLRAIGGSLRSIFTPFKGRTLRTLYRSNPEELVLALAVLVAFVFVFAYVFRIYFTYFNSRQFTRYPPSVAKYLRRALYFSNYSPDPKRALKNYKLALQQCDALGLDPFSDDVLGIRIQLASWLEQVQSYDAAIKVLELLLSDCKRWVDLTEKSVAEDAAKNDNSLSPRLPAPVLRDKAKTEAAEGEAAAPETETVWGRRSRILRKTIGISVKLGELYADEHVLNADLAHERLVWSVDTALKEFQRRGVDGTKDGEGEWMSPKEMGAALEALGQSYEARSQFHLALPLFFQALRLCSDPCHSAVIMNNLAASFAQHPVHPPYETLVGSVIDKAGPTPPTKEEAQRAYFETAQRWALNANQHATDTVGEARTPECDEACAVSLCNLGDIAVLLGNVGEAERRFKEARTMSETMAFAAGIRQADAGLSRLPRR